MSNVIVGHISTSTSGTCCPVTPPIDTTGSTIIYIFGYSVFTLGSPAGGFDNKGNTWVQLADPFSTCNGGMIGLRCINPIVGSGHTFSVSGSPSFSTEIIVVALRSQQVGAFDFIRQVSGANPVQVSTPITPPVDNSVLIASGMAGCGWTGTATVDSGLTIIDSQTHISVGLLVQPTAASINPTWTTLSTSTAEPHPTGAVIMECTGVFPPVGGDWQVYEA